jgi:hypothetical protein
VTTEKAIFKEKRKQKRKRRGRVFLFFIIGSCGRGCVPKEFFEENVKSHAATMTRRFLKACNDVCQQRAMSSESFLSKTKKRRTFFIDPSAASAILPPHVT